MQHPVEMPAKKDGLREKKRRELKDELSRTGIQLFTKKGFQTTTIDEIVEPLGVSKRTFFRYFPTKEDLVFAWYEELTGELVQSLAGRPKGEAPFDSVCETLGSLLHYYDDDPKWALAMVRLAKETPALMGKSFEKRWMWEKELAKTLQARLPKSATRDLRAKVIVGVAMAAFNYGVEEWAAAEGKGGDIRPFLDRAFAYVREL